VAQIVPLLALSLAAQLFDPRFQGSVVTDAGEPASGALVLVDIEWQGLPAPQIGSTTTDEQGRFRLALSRPKEAGKGSVVNGNRSHIFAHRKGSALAASSLTGRTVTLRLRQTAPRAVTVRQAGGKPLVGVKVMPRLVRITDGDIAEIPLELSTRLAATTGPDGKASLDGLAAWDELLVVRVTGASVASQDVILADRPGRAGTTGPMEIVLKGLSRIAGRVVDDVGKPVAGQEVEVWAQGSSFFFSCPVEFVGGPVRTRPDGSFQTPQGLLAGSTFRVAVRAPGKDVVVGDWITLGPQPRDVPEIVLGALRTIRGRVVDRAGKPIADAQLLQRGDGPEPTSARSDAEGRFALPGFRTRPVILFARKGGFRFHGQIVRPHEDDVTVALSRRDEAPETEMKPLPYPEMPTDAKAIARRLIEPVIDAAFRGHDSLMQSRALQCLAEADPAAALERLESDKQISDQLRWDVLCLVVESLARTDPEEAAGLAESMPTADLAVRSLVEIARGLSEERRALRMEMLDRAILKARGEANVGDRLWGTSAVARLWYDLGAIEKSRKLVMETLPVAREYTLKEDTYRGFFAAALAPFDLPAALEIGGEVAEGDRDRIKGLIATRLAAVNPAESERLWGEVKDTIYTESLEGCYRLALSAPERAHRIAAKEAERGIIDHYVMLAMGLVPHDRDAASAALVEGLDGVDTFMESPSARTRVNRVLTTALECVDRIDPGLTSEILWRYVATRPSAVNPRMPSITPSALLIDEVARYDRYLARILFAPIRARLLRATEADSNWVAYQFGIWTLLDPSAAVAAVERLSINPSRISPFNNARLEVARTLTRTEWRRRLGFLP
jgi:hypothetical protein